MEISITYIKQLLSQLRIHSLIHTYSINSKPKYTINTLLTVLCVELCETCVFRQQNLPKDILVLKGQIIEIVPMCSQPTASVITFICHFVSLFDNPAV